jgi:CO dehydrogenase/acetyl-CoA synthase gamma subunit (corrinoid Fe-S protein)
MDLPKTSRSYNAEIEELIIGKGDYVIGGARSPPFLDLDNARNRRPVIFGEAYDDLGFYNESAASMFSGRQNDIEEWAVMWKELGADGICLRLTKPDSHELAKRISDRTRIPVMISADTDILKKVAAEIDDSVLILYCRDREQSLEIAPESNNHIVVACCEDDDPQEMCRKMQELGAKNIIVDLGKGRMGPELKALRTRINDYRMAGLDGQPDSQHNIICDATPSWDEHGPEVTARRASMIEAMTALGAMMSGADVIVVKGPGAADMARVYGEELADL